MTANQNSSLRRQQRKDTRIEFFPTAISDIGPTYTQAKLVCRLQWREEFGKHYSNR